MFGCESPSSVDEEESASATPSVEEEESEATTAPKDQPACKLAAGRLAMFGCESPSSVDEEKTVSATPNVNERQARQETSWNVNREVPGASTAPKGLPARKLATGWLANIRGESPSSVEHEGSASATPDAATPDEPQRNNNILPSQPRWSASLRRVEKREETSSPGAAPVECNL